MAIHDDGLGNFGNSLLLTILVSEIWKELQHLWLKIPLLMPVINY